jgi:hypothetical protein
MVTPFQRIGRLRSASAPTVTLSPIIVPASILTRAPIRQLFPIKAGGWMGHLFTRGKMEPGAEPDWN